MFRFKSLSCSWVAVAALLAGLPLATQAAELPPPLEVLPDTVALEPGGTVQFTAVAHTAQGATFTPTNVRWLAAGGTIDGNGAYTAGARPGVYVVAAAHGMLRAAAQVEIKIFPKIVRVDVVPRQATLDIGQTCQLLAVATDAQGNPVPFVPQWSTGAGGTVTADGRFTPAAAGRHTVVAELVGTNRTGSAVVVAEAPGRQAAALRINPAAVQLQPGGRAAFTATALDPQGRAVRFAPLWSAGGGRIDANGVYTAGLNPGAFPVVVVDRLSGLKAAAVVTIGRRRHRPPLRPAGLTVTDWDIDGNFLRPRVKATVKVSGRAAARLKLFAVGGAGGLSELESVACKHGDEVRLSEKFIRVMTKWLELRLYDAGGNVIASEKRAAK